MRATRKKYYLASKQVLRSQNDLRNANIANAHYTSAYDFWSEVKRANACNAKSNARVLINGLSSPPDIANAFKDAYENIFRAGFTSFDDIQRFRIELNQRCESETFQRFTPDDVIKACLQLKSNKKDADLQLFSDAIINAPHDFFVVLCTLINAIIFHGHVPTQWLSGTIIPLLKSANIDKSITSSYRPITLSSVFGKIVDILIL